MPEPLATLTGFRVPTTEPSKGAAVAAEEDVEAERVKLGPAVPDTAATGWEEYAGVVELVKAEPKLKPPDDEGICLVEKAGIPPE